MGSHLIMRCTDINHVDNAIAPARRSLGKLVVVEEKALNHLHEVGSRER
jgi:hypothetical protein